MSPAGRRSGALDGALLLPVALLVPVVLSIFVLFSYRNSVSVLLSERRIEAAAMARALARVFSGRALPRDDELAPLRGPARAVALLDSAGDPLVVSGEFVGLAPAVEETTWWTTLTNASRDVVSGTAPLYSSGRVLTLQVDLPAGALLSAERGLRILSPFVLLVTSSLLLVVGLYLRRYLTPLDRLLRRARASGRVGEENDELDFLLQTFEEAVEKLAAPSRGDLQTLERALSKSVESGLLLLDEKGKVLALNEIGAELLGVVPPALGTPLEQLFEPHPVARDALREAVRREQRLERKDLALGDGERVLGLTLHPLKRADRSVRGFLALFFDITSLQRQAEELRLAESLAQVGELAAGVAHEMRNSLATLRGYLTLVERGGSEDDLSEYVRELRHETDHLKRVVDDFLTFARPGSTRMEAVDLRALLHRVLADPILGGMRSRLKGSIDGVESSFSVHGDAQLLERAFRNLLHNAAQAERTAGREGPLDVALFAGEGAVEIRIGDRGPGVPPEIRERLFHPFVSGQPGGVGLGLALTRRILDLHRGSIRLTDREGGGTEASVRLRLEEGDGASVT